MAKEERRISPAIAIIPIGLGLGAICLLAFVALAREPGPPEPPPGFANLYGYVTDKITGAPIVGAHGKVYQEYDTEGADYDLVTNSQGYYLIDNMTPDAVLTQMVIYAGGYETYTNENITIREGDNVLNVRMSPG